MYPISFCTVGVAPTHNESIEVQTRRFNLQSSKWPALHGGLEYTSFIQYARSHDTLIEASRTWISAGRPSDHGMKLCLSACLWAQATVMVDASRSKWFLHLAAYYYIYCWTS